MVAVSTCVAAGARDADQVRAVRRHAADLPVTRRGPLPPRAVPQLRARRRRHAVHPLAALHTCTTGETRMGSTTACTRPWPRPRPRSLTIKCKVKAKVVFLQYQDRGQHSFGVTELQIKTLQSSNSHSY